MIEQLRMVIKSEGVLLTVLPVAATLVYIGYQYGYLSYYGIPSDYIEPSLTGVFKAFVFLAIFLLWPLALYTDMAMDMARTKKTCVRFVGIAMMFGLPAVPFILLSQDSTKALIAFCVLVVIGVVVQVAAPRNVQIVDDETGRTMGLTTKISTLIVAVSICAGIAIQSGRWMARHQNKYLTSCTDESLLLITATDQGLVMCKTDLVSPRKILEIVLVAYEGSIELRPVTTQVDDNFSY